MKVLIHTMKTFLAYYSKLFTFSMLYLNIRRQYAGVMADHIELNNVLKKGSDSDQDVQMHTLN